MGQEPGLPDIRKRIEQDFPKLRAGEYGVSSPFDTSYNCIALAAGDIERWWWPDPQGHAYWPAGVARRGTLTAFAEAFGQLGYASCKSAEAEEGFEKVAIFVTSDGTPTHAARQLASGSWLSKLGRWEDIQHELEDIEGARYGIVGVIMKRATPRPTRER